MRVILGGLLLLTALAYSPLRHAGFVYEDANAVFANPSVTGRAPIAVDRARWVSELSHRIVWSLAGDRPVVHHAVNLALHLGNGLLVYAIAGAFLQPVGALLAAAIFLLHPLNVEAVAYIASRSELLACVFALLAFWVALDARRWWEHLAVWGCVCLAIGAKESAVVIVPLIAISDTFRGRRLSVWRYVALALPVALMAWSVLVLDYRAHADLTPLAYAAAQAYAVCRYLLLVLVPIGQSVDHDFEFVPAVLQYAALALLVSVAALCVLAQSTVGDEAKRIARLWDDVPGLRVATFGVTWMLLALAPRFVMRIPELLNEHQMLIPMVGISLALAAGVSRAETQAIRA